MMTDAASNRQHPFEGHISDAAASSWASMSYAEWDATETVVSHTWTAPAVAQGCTIDGSTTEGPCEVTLHQTMYVDTAGGLTVDAPFLVLSGFEGQIWDVAQARQLAQALLECADRLDGAA